MTQLGKKYFAILALVSLVIAILPAIWSLFHPGFFVSDDGEWMIIRLTDFHRSLADGQFPVRWLARLNYEYGYPVVNFLYPGFLYLGEFIHLLGFNFVNSIKIVLGLSIVFSGVFSYLWLSKIFNRLASFIGALFYVYAPYHLYDIYIRGSVGEVLALAVVPFCLWMAEKKNLPLLGLGYGLLIISHNTLALLFTPILLIYLFLTYRPLLYAILLGLGLSAFFWTPAIFDLKYTRFSKVTVSNFNEYFVHQELIGFSTFAILALVLALFLSKKIEVKKHRLTLLMFALGLISLFFSSSLSSSFWEILPISFVQFPFRFLSITMLAVAFLTASSLSVLTKKLKIIGGIIILLLVFVASRPFIAPSQFFDKGEGFYTTNEGTTTVRDEYMTRWAGIPPIERPKQKIEILAGKAEIKNQFVNSRKTTFKIKADEESLIQINTLYFPGWQAQVDKQRVNINYENERGIIQIPVNRGEHEVVVKFGKTPLRLFSDIISLFSFLFLVGLLIRNYFLKR